MKKVNWLIPIIGLCLAGSAYALDYNAIVTKHPSGNHQYKTLAAAIAAASGSSSSRYYIYVKNGIYKEKINLKTKNVSIIGQSQQGTVIEYEAASGQTDSNGDKWGTSGSYVLAVNASNVELSNLTIKNTFDFLTNDAKSSSDSTKISSSQAVALLIGTDAEKIKVRNVTVDGYQDSLYVKSGSLSYFKDCTVKGNIDFIFGDGTAVFDSCNIVSRPRGKETSPLGYVTAPSTNIDTPYGLVFYYSYLTKEGSVGPKSYGLGRPWHPTRTFSDGRYADPDAKGYTLYFHCYMDDHVYFWGKMSGKDINGNKIWFYPFKDARFAEYKSTGPGAKVITGYKRPQLSDSEAAKVTLKNILGGDWYKNNQPQLGIRHHHG